VSEEAGIEPRAVATIALAARRSAHLASSLPLKGVSLFRTDHCRRVDGGRRRRAAPHPAAARPDPASSSTITAMSTTTWR